MNVDRGKTSFTQEEIDDLRARLAEHKRYEGLSWDKLGKDTGIPAGTLSQWVPGKYAGDNAAVAERVNKFFLHQEGRRETADVAPIVPGFHFTPTARKITGTLRWAHEGEFALVIGMPGVSKTSAVRQYQATNPNVFVATMSPATRSVNATLLQVCEAVGANGRMSGNSYTLNQVAMARLSDRRALLVIDEAQHLRGDALEQLRAIHDATGCGLVLCGNPTVLTRVQGGAGKAADFAQLDSRISLPHVITRPDPEDVAVLLGAWRVVDEQERALLTKVAEGAGALRKFTQVLKLATLMANGTDEDRCLSHLKDALAQLRRPAA